LAFVTRDLNSRRCLEEASHNIARQRCIKPGCGTELPQRDVGSQSFLEPKCEVKGSAQE
jgi:hypothetical protein